MICIECSCRYDGYWHDDSFSDNTTGLCDWCWEDEQQELFDLMHGDDEEYM